MKNIKKRLEKNGVEFYTKNENQLVVKYPVGKTLVLNYENLCGIKMVKIINTCGDSEMNRETTNGVVIDFLKVIDPKHSYPHPYLVIEYENLQTFHLFDEVWKKIPNVDGFYEVSNYGEIRNGKKTEHRIQTVYNSNNGYEQAMFRRRGKKVNLYVHRLVAEAFCEKLHNNQQVDHIDGNRKNNISCNLRWVEPIENNYGRGRYFEYRNKPIKVLNAKTGGVVGVFLDYIEAGKFLNIKPYNIGLVLDVTKQNKTVNGYTMVFV